MEFVAKIVGYHYVLEFQKEKLKILKKLKPMISKPERKKKRLNELLHLIVTIINSILFPLNRKKKR